MAIIYVDANSTAVGTPNGSEALPYLSFYDIPVSAVSVNVGSTIYIAGDSYLVPTQSGWAGGLPIRQSLDAADPITVTQWVGKAQGRLIGGINFNDSIYTWNASNNGTNEYYLTLANGSDPALSIVNSATVDGYYWNSSCEKDRQRAMTAATYASSGKPPKGFIGSMPYDKQYGWGDNDSLGFDTVYVRIDSGSPADYEIIGSQSVNLIDTNMANWAFDGIHLLYGNTSVIDCRPASTWTFTNCTIAYADYNGIEVTNSGATAILENCLFYWCGHRAMTLLSGGTIKANHCVEFGAHLTFLVSNASGTIELSNCVGTYNEAGVYDVQNASATVTLEHNHFSPRMFELDGTKIAGSAIGYVNSSNFPSVPLSNNPANVASSVDDVTAFSDPMFVAVDPNKLSNCDFRLKEGSPLIRAGYVTNDADFGTTDATGATRNAYTPNIGMYAGFEAAPTSSGTGSAPSQEYINSTNLPAGRDFGTKRYQDDGDIIGNYIHTDFPNA